MQLFTELRNRTRHVAVFTPPLRPVVWVTVVYAQLLSLWFSWLMSTARVPRAGAPEAYRIYSTFELTLTSVIDAALIAWLVFDLVGSRRAPAGLSRARVAGALGGIGLVASIQTLALLAHDPHSPPIWLW
ncbi:hypothetical protein Pla163_08770 [Planctomycetes bacterium Pla163]|uniref:Uncharacterized protein n=1 Tax=Rohdeia mirabilis TaxID=2528008 RepID=A0A518CX41_9BACT|nr:hypothetical protein Pla163_08770 [Planctomycetes bacterium Pla163]